jgi:hypothetical protein
LEIPYHQCHEVPQRRSAREGTRSRKKEVKDGSRTKP